MVEAADLERAARAEAAVMRGLALRGERRDPPLEAGTLDRPLAAALVGRPDRSVPVARPERGAPLVPLRRALLAQARQAPRGAGGTRPAETRAAAGTQARPAGRVEQAPRAVPAE
jgi:hypothetical protein